MEIMKHAAHNAFVDGIQFLTKWGTCVLHIVSAAYKHIGTNAVSSQTLGPEVAINSATMKAVARLCGPKMRRQKCAAPAGDNQTTLRESLSLSVF